VGSRRARPRAHRLGAVAHLAARRHCARAATARLQLQDAAQMLLGALRSALSAKLRDGELKVVQAFTFADHKTRKRDGRDAKLEAAARCWW